MGRVFRAYYTQTGVYELDAKGNPVIYAKGRKKGQPKHKRFYSDTWTIEYTDAIGKLIHREGGLTEADAKDALRKAEAEVLAERNGLPTAKAGDLLLSDLATAYLAEQERRVCPAHLVGLRHRLKAILADVRIVKAKDLRPEAIENVLDALEEDDRSARTINTYLQAIKGMLAWAVQRRKLPFNPLDSVAKRSEVEKVRIRRALSDEELGRLLAASLEGPARRMAKAYRGGVMPLTLQAGLADQGRRNALIVFMLVQTGLRVKELRNLTWGDLDLDAGTLHCRATWTKNKKGESLPIHPSLVKTLRTWQVKTGGEAGRRVVTVPMTFLKSFNDDLVAAGMATRTRNPKTKKLEICKTNAAGQTLDLHCLRHTFGTRLNRAGVDIKTVQTLMRHSTPSMTLGIYIHSDKNREEQAIAALPELTPTTIATGPLAAAATGTDDAFPVSQNDLGQQAGNKDSCNSLPSKAISPASGAVDRGSIPFRGTSEEKRKPLQIPAGACAFDADTPKPADAPECSEAQQNAVSRSLSQQVPNKESDADFAAAVRAVMALPLTDAEKAEAVRRLLAGGRP